MSAGELRHVLHVSGYYLTHLQHKKLITERMSRELYSALSTLCRAAVQALSSYELSRDPIDLDYLVFQVYKLFRISRTIDVINDQVLESFSSTLALLESLQDMEVESQSESYVTCTYANYNPPSGTGRGRPKLNITCEQLEYLLSMNFMNFTCSDMIGVSLRTVRRRMSDYGLSVKSLYSNINFLMMI